MGDKGVDLQDQFPGALERPPADGPLGDDPEPALHLVQPGGIGGGVMDVEPGMAGQPGADLLVLMRGIVVDDQVDVEIGRHVVIDLFQEREELLVAVAGLAPSQNRSVGHVQGGEEGRGAVTDVIVGDALHIAQAHRQDRLGPIQGLDLGLLVHAQDHRMVGRVQIEPHDLPDLFDEAGVGRELERLRPVGLHPEELEGPLDRAFRQPRRFGGAPDRPGVPFGRTGVQNGAKKRGHLVLVVDPGAPRPLFPIESGQPLGQEPGPPQSDRGGRHPQTPGDGQIGLSVRGGQNDLGPPDQPMGRGSRPDDAVEFSAFDVGQDDLLGFRPGHVRPPFRFERRIA